MMKKLLVTLIASAFTLTAFAQAQKAEPKGQTGTTTQPATPAKGDKPVKKTKAKTEKKAKAKTDAKAKAKSDEKK